jgi:hypothetical protein
LPPFWNRLPRSLLWNCVNNIVQPLNSVSLIQPRWSTWGTRVNAPLPWQKFSVIFLSCKANTRVYDAKSGNGPHSPPRRGGLN